MYITELAFDIMQTITTDIIKTNIVLTSVYCNFKINNKIKFIYYCVSIAGREIVIFLILKSDIIGSIFCTKQKEQ